MNPLSGTAFIPYPNDYGSQRHYHGSPQNTPKPPRRKAQCFNLLPDTLTMKEVQKLYEAVYDRPFAINNFQKKILDLNVLERLEKKFTGAQNKAPYLYRFKKT